MHQSASTLINVKNLSVQYRTSARLRNGPGANVVKAVNDVSFSIYRGETLGLVGESGCGKSTTGRAVTMLVRPTSGDVVFEGKELTTASNASLRGMRRSMQMIFQDPFSSLTPYFTVGSLIAEPIRVHKLRATRQEIDERVADLLELVGLNPDTASKYPYEFSGGQRQRIGIARALAMEPSFIVCDESVSALDVSVQAQVVNLLQDLQAQLGLTYLFIAHDLGVVHHISDRIAVMYLGKIVEIAEADQLVASPAHPYTEALLSAVPSASPRDERVRERVLLKGDIPSPLSPPSGCHFHTRCPRAIERCKNEEPDLRPITFHGIDRLVACHRADE